MKNLKEDSGTGPDLLAAKVLKHCFSSLAIPVAMLARLILKKGIWPAMWKVHWISPLYKKKAVFDAANYRGVHLTPQLSKVVERLLGRFLLPFFEATDAYGPNQFAYAKGKGCKDALATNVLQWIWWLHNGYQIALYCSDVSGAFDRVKATKLIEKLQKKGVTGEILNVIQSWLGEREAKVVVNGTFSKTAKLNNMVFQGTVWGPPLWNCFFEDARAPVRKSGFDETVFADDLNCCNNLTKTFQTPKL